MSDRVDTASRLIHASASAIYRAFATPSAMEAWLAPDGMTARMLAFAFREGGSYRMRLTYDSSQDKPGKTSEDADEVKVRFVKLVPDERIEQAVTFNSEDPAFSGEMRIAWTFDSGRNGTFVTVQCENVPSGIRPADHQAGLASTLRNLAAFADGTARTPDK
jgi:uncharacterized protein YndB with AHSA1/START domain